ncbi:MAG TPA: radical SAM protein [Vicinamibacterales bacterium]
MKVFLVNPSPLSFGTAVITPRWLFVLAAATPEKYGTPVIVDETLERFDTATVKPGDVVGIGIHTGNALRGYEIGHEVRKAGGVVVYGGIHATLYADEAREHGVAHAVVSGDGDLVWQQVLADCEMGAPKARYDGGRVSGESFSPARWDLLPEGKYMWATVQTVRGCPKHCSFCSVWRTDGQTPRQRNVAAVVREIVALRRKGFRFVVLADDNFYPVTKADLAAADRRTDKGRYDSLNELREERFALMAQLERLPDDLVFFTQITMEAAEDVEFLAAMRRAKIRGALVGVESVTPEGLKAVFKNFNDAGDALVTRLQKFRENGVHVLGSFIFGLPTDKADTFMATADLAQKAGITMAQFVLLQPLPGTLDFERWEKEETNAPTVDGIPLTRYWLIPGDKRPKVYMPHPSLSPDEIKAGTQMVWDRFYSLPAIWQRSGGAVKSLKARLAFVLLSKLYRQMYANTGMTTDSARIKRSARRARVLAGLARRLFIAAPMPDLAEPPGLSEIRTHVTPAVLHVTSRA